MIIIYTAITAGRDNLQEDQFPGNAKFVAFMDKNPGSSRWDLRRCPEMYKDPRRNARLVKMLPHEFLPEATVSIWMDGSIQLHADPNALVDKYLKDNDIAIFKHPMRTCLFEEAQYCLDWFIGDKDRLTKQIDRYEKDKMPHNFGLWETKVVIRRHTKKMEKFNKEWLYQLTTNSERDQVSLPYVAYKLDVKIAEMPPLTPPDYKTGEFSYIKHGPAYNGNNNR